MAGSFATSIVCPVLIGRAPHLEELVHALEQACSGTGQTVLVTGEAGIGKSRLVDEAIAHVRSWRSETGSSAPLILQGRCFELDSPIPYAPLLDLLRTFFAPRSPEDMALSFGPTAAELVKLLPELATLLPDLAPSPVLEPAREKRRLYQALTNFLTRLSATGPVLLIVKDLHWSDESCLEFLLFLARRLALHPILLILTYRSEEEPPALTSLLRDLSRERLSTGLQLSHLGIAEVGAMIRATLALERPLRADVLEMVYALTEGNPFFIEEVLKSLITAGEIISVDGR